MQEINIETWNRKDIYQTFSQFENPFYSVTIPVDVTTVKQYSKEHGLSFYHTMIWCITKAVNRVPEFNLRIRDGHLYQLDHVDPDFTVLRPGADVFQFMFLPWEENLEDFCKSVKEQIAWQAEDTFGNAGLTDAAVYFTCTPWFDFTAVTNPHRKDTEDTIPRLAWGKYYEENGRWIVHMSIEVNHRTIDGYHIGQLKQAIDEEFAALQV